jgi:Mce-associated membrane protein
VLSSAGRFGVALFTYDYNDLPAARAKVVALATARFAKGYRTATAPAQDAAILRLKAREAARLASVYTTNVHSDRAGAVVVVRTTVQSSEGTRITVSYLQMALVRQGGQHWKVDTVNAIPSP